MKCRKKPIVIDAYELPETDMVFCTNEVYSIPIWVKLAFYSDKIEYEGSVKKWIIRTLEGIMHANPGDYLIKGAVDELYPCKRDIFHETYEVIDDRTEFTENKN